MKQNNNQASPAKTKHIAVYGVDSYGDENAVYGSEADQAQENKAVSSDNRISVVVDPAVKAQFIQKIRDAWALLPFLINVPPDEKAHMSVISTKRAGMDEVFITAMTQHPELVPAFVVMAEVMKDLNFRHAMEEMMQPVLELARAMDDTTAVSSHESFIAYSDTYANTKTASQRNVPGVDVILKAMAVFFKTANTSTAKPKPAAEPAP